MAHGFATANCEDGTPYYSFIVSTNFYLKRFYSIMLIYSLIVAAINGEPVGSIFLSQELGFSLILMNVWRYLYATYD